MLLLNRPSIRYLRISTLDVELTIQYQNSSPNPTFRSVRLLELHDSLISEDSFRNILHPTLNLISLTLGIKRYYEPHKGVDCWIDLPKLSNALHPRAPSSLHQLRILSVWRTDEDDHTFGWTKDVEDVSHGISGSLDYSFLMLRKALARLEIAPEFLCGCDPDTALPLSRTLPPLVTDLRLRFDYGIGMRVNGTFSRRSCISRNMGGLQVL